MNPRIQETAERYVLARDAVGLRQFLDKHGNREQVHGTTRTHMTFLYYAIKAGDLELVKVLLDKGARLNVGCRGFNATEAAAFYYKKEIFIFILGEEADNILRFLSGSAKNCNVTKGIMLLRGCAYLKQREMTYACRCFYGTASEGKTMTDLLLAYFFIIQNYTRSEKHGWDVWISSVWQVEDLFVETKWDEFLPRFLDGDYWDYYVVSRYVLKVEKTVKQAFDLLFKINHLVNAKLNVFQVNLQAWILTSTVAYVATQIKNLNIPLQTFRVNIFLMYFPYSKLISDERDSLVFSVDKSMILLFILWLNKMSTNHRR